MRTWRVLVGDVRERLADLADQSVQCVCTSPPYWALRDYGVGGQIGMEATPDEFVDVLVGVFREVRRVLRDDGTLWMNLGDSYLAQQGAGFNGQKRLDHANRNVKVKRPAGMKPKDLAGIPWLVAFALRADGWYLRSDIIWHKPNPMPESVTDRPTKAHEYVFLLTKRERYYYDADAIAEPLQTDPSENYPARAQIIGRGGLLSLEQSPTGQAQQRSSGGFPPRGYRGQATKDYAAAGAQNPSDTKRRILESMANGEGRNARSVWTITTQPYPEAHFATFPEALPERCIKAGSRIGDVVLDPFCGSGTTGQVAIQLGRDFVGIELNQAYAELARTRIGNAAPLFAVESPQSDAVVDLCAGEHGR